VTFRSGHMGNTFLFLGGDVDAVERLFGYGRTLTLCRPLSPSALRTDLIQLDTVASDTKRPFQMCSITASRERTCPAFFDKETEQIEYGRLDVDAGPLSYGRKLVTA
jgi:hypothetical protein